ncbi:MAG: HAD hydrolase family protein [Planctomycetota bacterium]
MAIDLVICDIDGCLAAEAGGPFDLELLGPIAAWNREAEAAGRRAPLTVCTGRPQPFAQAMCRLLHNNTTPCVAEHGVWLWDPASGESQIDPSITPAHLEVIHAAEALLLDRYGASGVSLLPGKRASVTLCHADPALLQAIAPEVQQVLEERGWPLHVSMTWNYINCDLRHVSKASGVRRLFEATGVDATRSVGIGDTSSDLPVAQAAGWFGCPSNACEELKQHADYVSPWPEARGVLDILDRAKGRE